MTKSIMEQLAARPNYPKGHMGERIAEFEQRFNNLFDGNLRLLFIVPSDHMLDDGTINHDSLEREIQALLAVDEREDPTNERVTEVAEHLGNKMTTKASGAAYCGDYLTPEDTDNQKMRGIIYPGTSNFTSGRVIAGYSGDNAYEAHVFKGAMRQSNLHLDRVVYHEMGHKVLDFMDMTDHPVAKAHPYPEVPDDVSDEYLTFRGENYADGFMALMMVRDHGEVGREYSEMIAHTRGLGFENASHCYYTNDSIAAALEIADEYGDSLKDAPVEELASALYTRQHEKMWSPEQFEHARAEQMEADRKLLTDELTQDDLERFAWLSHLRAKHDAPLAAAMAHPEAAIEGHPARDDLIADYTAERRDEMNFVWETPEQKQAIIYTEKQQLRADIAEGKYVVIEGDEVGQANLTPEERIVVLDELSQEYRMENQQEQSLTQAQAVEMGR